MWEGLAFLLGLIVVIGIFVLPVITICIINGLRSKIEDLYMEVRILKSLMKGDKKAEPAQQPLHSIQKEPTQAQPLDVPLPKPLPLSVPSIPAPPPPPPPEPCEPSAFETTMKAILSRTWNWIIVGGEFRKPGVSTEFAFATTWLVRVGVLALVLAVGFLLQLSIAKGILGPAGRVSMSMLFGAVLVLLGIRCMTRRLEMLGQGFIGGGLALFYFAFYAMSIMYNLISMPIAFGGMILVTVAAVVMATRLNALSIAVFGLIGGYLTPVVLKTPEPNYSMLYLYLLLLALGIVGVAFKRQWPVLTWLSFVFNSLIFYFTTGAVLKWTAGQVTSEHIWYLCGFFVLYSKAIYFYAIRYRVSATPLEIISLFVNALVAFAFGAFFIGYAEVAQRIYLSILALGIAIYYMVHIWSLFLLWQHVPHPHKRIDRVLMSGYIALVAIFLGIALPLLFTGHILTCMFSLQALAFLWLGRRLDNRMFTFGAFAFYAVTLLRMAIGFMDGEAFDIVTRQTYFATLAQRLIEFVVPIASLFAASWIAELGLRKWLVRVTGAMLFVYLSFEVATFFDAYVPEFSKWSVSMVWGCYGLALLLWGLHTNGRASRITGLILFAVTIGKVFLFDLSGSDVLYRLIAFAVLGGVLLLGAYAYLRKQDVFKAKDE
jgi:uncharacterized membrane protein